MKDKWFKLFFIIILEQNYKEDFLSLCMPLHLKNSHWFLKIQENSDFYLRPLSIYSRKKKVLWHLPWSFNKYYCVPDLCLVWWWVLGIQQWKTQSRSPWRRRVHPVELSVYRNLSHLIWKLLKMKVMSSRVSLPLIQLSADTQYLLNHLIWF